ncbi:4'-phosphopantetheinyl transferase family protein [Alistipes sp.]|uniref:4'-phosphopantetheinyl transferase family protein n=1 Tax=Alistipes sp. TaxID=1872444 RepID=UPI003AF0106E
MTKLPTDPDAPRLVVAPLMEEAEAAAWATAEERDEARRMGSERRRREWLTWRALVRCTLAGRAGCNLTPAAAAARFGIAYDAAGAPIVSGCAIHISVAHCPGRVVVCLSPQRCAVDIEPEARDFTAAADRFMTPAERALSDDPLLPCAVWCAKETLYKYAGRKGLDLLRDLHVDEVDLVAGTIRARIENGEPLRLGMRREAGFLVVFIG